MSCIILQCDPVHQDSVTTNFSRRAPLRTPSPMEPRRPAGFSPVPFCSLPVVYGDVPVIALRLATQIDTQPAFLRALLIPSDDWRTTPPHCRERALMDLRPVTLQYPPRDLQWVEVYMCANLVPPCEWGSGACTSLCKYGAAPSVG